MKLSEAIREGCKLRTKQCRHTYFLGDNASCAMGAACDAVGNIQKDEEGITYVLDYPGNVFDNACKRIEDPDRELSSVLSIVMRLNDESCWTREEIATWLEKKDL